jgi:hypothetical protein
MTEIPQPREVRKDQSGTVSTLNFLSIVGDASPHFRSEKPSASMEGSLDLGAPVLGYPSTPSGDAGGKAPNNQSPFTQQDKDKPSTFKGTSIQSNDSKPTDAQPGAPKSGDYDPASEAAPLEALTQAKENTKGWNSPDAPPASVIQEKIKDAQVIYWGDDHGGDTNAVQRLANALGQLKVNTVVMEEFKQSQQGLINKYLSDPKGSPQEQADKNSIQDYLVNGIKLDPKNKIDLETIKKEMALLQLFKDKKMRVLAAEPDGAKITGADNGDPCIPRDPNWVRTVTAATDAGAKVLVFGGSFHFERLLHNTFAELMANNPQIRTVDLTPPDDYSLMIPTKSKCD